MTVLNFQPGLEQSSWDPGFDHNTVRDSGNVNGIRDLTAAQETRFAKTTRLGKRAILGREMTEFQDAGFSAGSGSHFPDPVSKDHTVVTPEDSKIQDWETERYKERMDGSSGRGILHGIRASLSRPYFKKSRSFSSLKITRKTKT